MKNEPDQRLQLLGNARRYRVAKGEPDIRGWDVVSADKKKIGAVHDLVIDTVDQKVRYLDLEVEGKILEVKGSSHVLVPIAGAALDSDDNRVYLDRISTEELKALPAYDHRPVTREFEMNVTSWFRRATEPRTDVPQAEPARTEVAAPPAPPPPAAKATDRDLFYDDEPFAERRFWGERRRGREEQTYVVPAEEERLP